MTIKGTITGSMVGAAIWFVLLALNTFSTIRKSPDMPVRRKWGLALFPIIYVAVAVVLIMTMTEEAAIWSVFIPGILLSKGMSHHDEGVATIAIVMYHSLVTFTMFLLVVLFACAGSLQLLEWIDLYRYGFLVPIVLVLSALVTSFTVVKGTAARILSFLLCCCVLLAVLGFGGLMLDSRNDPYRLYLFLGSLTAFIINSIVLGYSRECHPRFEDTVSFFFLLTLFTGLALSVTFMYHTNVKSIWRIGSNFFISILPILVLWFVFYLIGRFTDKPRRRLFGDEPVRLHGMFWIVFGPLLLLLSAMISLLATGVYVVSALSIYEWWKPHLPDAYLVPVALVGLAVCLALFVRNWMVWRIPLLNIVFLLPFFWVLALFGNAMGWVQDTVFAVVWTGHTALLWILMVTMQLRQDREAKALEQVGEAGAGT